MQEHQCPLMATTQIIKLRATSRLSLSVSKCQISSFQPEPKIIAPCAGAQTTRLLSHTPAAQHNQPGLVLNFPLGGADNQKKAPVE